MFNIRLAPFVALWSGVLMLSLMPCWGQTSASGALAGTILDPSGALVGGAQVKVINQATGEIRNTVSQA